MSETDPAEYGYEDSKASNPSTLRRREDAERAALRMLRNLKVAPEIIDRVVVEPGDAADRDADEAWERLVRYAMDVHLNIRWYHRAKGEQERRRMLWVTLTVLIGTIIIVFPFLYPLIVYHTEWAPQAMQKARPSIPEIQASLIVAALGSGWKFISNLGDSSTRVGIFWEAYADLKEELLSFESAWRGKASIESGLSPAFLDALYESLRRAHTITRKERLAFFGTYKSPATILQSAADTAEDLAKARAARAKEPDHASHAEKVAAAEQALAEAKEAVMIKEEIMKGIAEEFPSASDPNVARAKAAYSDALGARITAEQQLRQLRSQKP